MNLNEQKLKLSDIDKSKLVFDVHNNVVTYQDGIRNNRYRIDSLSLEIQEYCISKVKSMKIVNKLVDLNTREILKLSEINLETFKFDKENDKVIIDDDNIINISDIVSDEIRFHCINHICDMTNEKEICKYFIRSIKINNNNSNILVLNMELYNKIKSLNHKIYINKYIFMKYKGISIPPDITKKLLSIYTNDSSSLLIDLIKDIIVTKSGKSLELILKNKSIIIKNTDYEKLKEFAISSHSTEVYDILTIYESLDYLSNDIYFDKVKKS